ncbi:MAG: hypothetical protein JNL67_06165 [Planctomycetaceae bacterium]|nr:hypothetical protein [Planctomycetaceae bacterium]
MTSNWGRWFSLLRPKVHEFADTFVATRSQLNQNLVHWLPSSTDAPVTLLLAHYPRTFEQLQSVLEQHGVPYRIHVGALDAPLVNQWCRDRLNPHQQDRSSFRGAADDRVASLYLGLVGQISLLATAPGGNADRDRDNSRSGRYWPSISKEARISILVAERHSSRQADDQVRHFCRQLEARTQLGFFLAFDDPLLSGRIDTAMQQLLEHYGMRPDEPLQSLLLERLVRRIQRSADRP